MPQEAHMTHVWPVPAAVLEAVSFDTSCSCGLAVTQPSNICLHWPLARTALMLRQELGVPVFLKGPFKAPRVA